MLIAAALLAIAGTYIELKLMYKFALYRDLTLRNPWASIVSSVLINFVLATLFGATGQLVLMGAMGSVILSLAVHKTRLAGIIVRTWMKNQAKKLMRESKHA